jgi:hypothetical protein
VVGIDTVGDTQATRRRLTSAGTSVSAAVEIVSCTIGQVRLAGEPENVHGRLPVSGDLLSG